MAWHDEMKFEKNEQQQPEGDPDLVWLNRFKISKRLKNSMIKWTLMQ